MGKHDDHEEKTSGDAQVSEDTVIQPAPRDDGGRHRKDGGDKGDKHDKDQDKK